MDKYVDEDVGESSIISSELSGKHKKQLETTSSEAPNWLKLSSFKYKNEIKNVMDDNDDNSDDEYIEFDIELLMGKVKKVGEKMRLPKNTSEQQKLIRKSRRLKRRAIVELSKKRPTLLDINGVDKANQLQFKVDLKGEYLVGTNLKHLVPKYAKIVPIRHYLTNICDFISIFDSIRYYLNGVVSEECIDIFPNETKNISFISDEIIKIPKISTPTILHSNEMSPIDSRITNICHFFSSQSLTNEVADVNKALDTNPYDIDMWLKLIELHRLKLPSDAPSELILQSQEAVLQKALQKNPNSCELLLKSLYLFSHQQAITTDDYDKRWRDITFQYPNNIGIWCKYIEYLMLTFSKSTANLFTTQIHQIISKLNDLQSPYVQPKQRIDPLECSKFQLKIICYFGLFLALSGNSEKLSTCLQLIILYNMSNFLIKKLITPSEESFHDAFTKYFTTHSSKLGDVSFSMETLLKNIMKAIDQPYTSIEMLQSRLIPQLSEKNQLISDLFGYISKYVNNSSKIETLNEDSILKCSQLQLHEKWLALENYRTDQHYFPLNLCEINANKNFIDSVEDSERIVNESKFFPMLVLFEDINMLYELIYLYLFLIDVPIKSSYIPVCYPIIESLSLFEESVPLTQMLNGRLCDEDMVIHLKNYATISSKSVIPESSRLKSSITQTIIYQLLVSCIFQLDEFCKMVSIWILFLTDEYNQKQYTNPIIIKSINNNQINSEKFKSITNFTKKILSISHCRNSNLLWIFYCVLHSLNNSTDSTLIIVKNLIDMQFTIVSQLLKSSNQSTESVNELSNLISLIRLYGDIVYNAFITKDDQINNNQYQNHFESYNEWLAKLMSILENRYVDLHNIEFTISSVIERSARNEYCYVCDLLILRFYYSQFLVNNSPHDIVREFISSIHKFFNRYKKLIQNSSIKYMCLLRYMYHFTFYYVGIGHKPIIYELKRFFMKFIDLFPSVPSFSQFYCIIFKTIHNPFDTRLFFNKSLSKLSSTVQNKLYTWENFVSYEIIKFNEFLVNNSLLYGDCNIAIECLSRSSSAYRLKTLVEYAISDSEYSFKFLPAVWRKSLYIASIIGDKKFFESIAYRALQNCGWCKNIYLDILSYNISLSDQFIINLMTERGLRIRVILEEFQLLLEDVSSNNN